MSDAERSTLSTGKAAKIAGVSLQTIIRAMDGGDLQGFRIPGSNHRRIHAESLMAWMQRNHMTYQAANEPPGEVSPVALADRAAESQQFRETDIAVNIDRKLWQRLQAVALRAGRPAKAELEMVITDFVVNQETEGVAP